jgi:L-aspartate oxidase
VPGLYAAGEVAATGVHGANRLASNSLLEGLVFGAAAGSAMLEEQSDAAGSSAAPLRLRGIPDADAARVMDSVRTTAWEKVGILRDGPTLASALATLEEDARLATATSPSRRGLEALNMTIVARMIARCALFREESRGAHFRTDFPLMDDAHWRCHTRLIHDEVTKGPLIPGPTVAR